MDSQIDLSKDDNTENRELSNLMNNPSKQDELRFLESESDCSEYGSKESLNEDPNFQNSKNPLKRLLDGQFSYRSSQNSNNVHRTETLNRRKNLEQTSFASGTLYLRQLSKKHLIIKKTKMMDSTREKSNHVSKSLVQKENNNFEYEAPLNDINTSKDFLEKIKLDLERVRYKFQKVLLNKRELRKNR